MAVSVILARPEILADSLKGWPNVIPAATCAVLLFAGIWSLMDGAAGAIIGGLWIVGASWFADRPLEAAGWPWPGSYAVLVAAYSLAAIVLAREWHIRRSWCLRLSWAILWPWLAFLPLADVVLDLNGIIGTALLIACATANRYHLKEKLA